MEKKRSRIDFEKKVFEGAARCERETESLICYRSGFGVTILMFVGLPLSRKKACVRAFIFLMDRLR